MGTTENAAVEAISEQNAYQLAGLADCASPDSPESDGAKFLESVRDAVVEEIEANGVEDWEDRDGILHEIADNAPDVYTHTRWSEFVDLAAYNEDISEYGEYGNDLTQAAAVALYMIAERLVRALFSEAADAHWAHEGGAAFADVDA